VNPLNHSAWGSSQLNTLFKDAFGGCGTSSDAAAILSFMNLLGGPLENDRDYIGSSGFINAPDPFFTGFEAVDGISVIEPSISVVHSSPDFGGGQLSSYGSTDNGSWLVRTTAPEPASFSLMGAGCLVFLGFARRRSAVRQS
jgi:hypothetical protein